MSFTVNTSVPDFDLTDRLIQLAKMEVWPLFTMTPEFHRYEDRTFVIMIGSPESPLLFTKKDSLAVSYRLLLHVCNRAC